MPSPPGHSFYGGGGREYRDRDYNRDRGYGGGKGGSRPRAAPIARPSTDYEEKLEQRAYGGDEKKRRDEARRRDAEERGSRRAAGQEADLGRSEAYWKMAAASSSKTVPYDRARIPAASVRASTQPPQPSAARASCGDKGVDPWSKLDPWGGANTGLRPKKEAPAAPAAAEPAKPAATKEEHWRDASASAAQEAAAPPERPDSAWAAKNGEARWGDAGSSGYESKAGGSAASPSASAADNWQSAEASAWQAPAVVWEEKAWEAKSWEAPATSSWDDAGWKGKSWETSSVATSTWSDDVITRFGRKMAESVSETRDYTREAKARRAALRKEESERRRREKEAAGIEPASSSTSDPWKAAPAEPASAAPEGDAWGKGPETLSLVLAGIDLSDADVEWRCEGWSQDLASGKVEWPQQDLVVDLRDNNITDKGLERLLCWLCEQRARPEQLLLSGNPLSEPVCLPHLLRHDECGIKAALWRLELEECQLSQDVFRRCLETCAEVKRRPPLRWSLRRGDLGKLRDCLDEAVAKGLRADTAGLEKKQQFSPFANLQLDADVELVYEASRLATFAEEEDPSLSWAAAGAATAWQ